MNSYLWNRILPIFSMGHMRIESTHQLRHTNPAEIRINRGAIGARIASPLLPRKYPVGRGAKEIT